MQQLVRRIRAGEADPPWGLLWALGAVFLAFIFHALVGTTIGLLIGLELPANIAVGLAIGAVLTIAFVMGSQRGHVEALQLRSNFPLLIAFGGASSIPHQRKAKQASWYSAFP
ncbi:MAG: hypothetical protein AAF125_17680, partial [Chloroflexota bacterium]